ncbi:MAG: hypothetical protein AB7E55_21830 [Pigmentiphaga sp.]|nr:hypothetical protein [Pigmentiphaga sp.]
MIHPALLWFVQRTGLSFLMVLRETIDDFALTFRVGDKDCRDVMRRLSGCQVDEINIGLARFLPFAGASRWREFIYEDSLY